MPTGERVEGPSNAEDEFRASLTEAALTQTIIMNAATEYLAKAKAEAKALNAAKRCGPPPGGPPPKLLRPAPPPIPKQVPADVTLPTPPSNLVDMSQQIEKAPSPDVAANYLKGIPLPPPKPPAAQSTGGSAWSHPSVPKPPPPPARAVPEPPRDDAVKRALLRPTWIDGEGYAAKALSSIPERDEGRSDSPLPLLSPKEEVTPSVENPFVGITSAFLDPLPEDFEMTVEPSPPSEASVAIVRAEGHSKRSSAKNKIKTEAEPSPAERAPCTPTSDAEIISETHPVAVPNVPLIQPKLEEYEVDEADSHFVRQIAIPYLDLRSSYTPTQHSIEFLRIAYEQKAALDAGLYKLSMSSDQRVAI